MVPGGGLELERAEVRRAGQLVSVAAKELRLLRYLVCLSGNLDTARDLFQETWLRVLERGSQYDSRRDFGAWLFAVARNLFLDSLRKKRPVSLEAMAGESDEPYPVADTRQLPALEAVAQREVTQRVAATLDQLSPEYREVIVLRFQEELSLEEIAAVTRAPLGTIKSRLYRGLNQMMPLLQGDDRDV